jgi:hypothetical protein
MQKIRIILFLLIVNVSAHGQYITPGSGVNWDLDELMNQSGGVISFDGIHYIFSDDITISNNDTVQLLEAASIKVESGKLITIGGVLYADPLQPITFSAIDTSLNFLGFRFEDNDGSQLKNCNIQFGGGIKLVNANIKIEDCTIRQNNTENCTGAIDLYQSNPTIQGCDILMNEGPAVMSGANASSSPYVSGNFIYHNNTANQNMPQINLGISADEVDIIIENNIIEGFYTQSGGIALSTLIGGNLNAQVIGNTIINNRYGITAYGNNIQTIISDNIIQDNNIQNDPMLGGSGINFYGNSTNQSIVSRNIISGNLWGITIQNVAMPNMGQLTPDTVNIGLNTFENNGNGGEIYALYNNTPNDIFAENNYWGTFDPEVAETFIFHQPDDASLGYVDYLPLKDYLTDISKEPNQNDELIKNIFPNPFENDLTIHFSGNEAQNLKEIKIFCLDGRCVFTDKVGGEEVILSNLNINSGLYILEVKAGQNRFIQKLIRK